MVVVLEKLRKMAPTEEEASVITRFEVVLTGLPKAS